MRSACALALGAILMGCADSDEEVRMPEHAVLVYFDYGSKDLGPMFALEEKLEAAIIAEDVGEFDGNEVAVDGSDATFFMYGPDADKLFGVVRPILETAPFMRGAKVKLRYGPPADGVREVEVLLGS